MVKAKKIKKQSKTKLPKKPVQTNDQEKGKKLMAGVVGGSCLLAIILGTVLLIIGYNLYQNWQGEDTDETTESDAEQSNEETVPQTSIYAVETDYIYLEVPLPDFMSGKDSGLYVTLSSNDDSITLYVAGECEGCTVVPLDDSSFTKEYTTVIEEITMNGQTCKRTAYLLKDAGTYELYEVSCTGGDEEVHVWGECTGDWSKVVACDEIVKSMVVENI